MRKKENKTKILYSILSCTTLIRNLVMENLNNLEFAIMASSFHSALLGR